MLEYPKNTRNINVFSRHGQTVAVIILALCFNYSMLKKSGILLSSRSNLQCYYASSSHKSTTSQSYLFASQNHQPQHLHQQCLHQRRTYAIVSDGRSANQHGGLRWPELTSAHAIPTPYQIFNQKKSSPYSKRRFYELVKLYHPDKHGIDIDTNEGLSYDTKLSRYRLVIAANDILSDVVKRSAYDTYGAGWNGSPEALDPRDKHGEYRGWTGPNGPSQNATWEDWEKWHKRDAKGKQEPRFVSNGAFVWLIAVFVVLGGLGQLTRFEEYEAGWVERRDRVHEGMSRELRARRGREDMDMYRVGSREERISGFFWRQRRDLRGEGFGRGLQVKGVGGSESRRDGDGDGGGGGKGREMVVYQPPPPPPKNIPKE
ncbi:hypothetical protein SBOR_6710 [Sclerotinia borealis F-4128]|uniref:J domain-containing protein n=1 Tax=Sclerotinia borealis (strain F-4128) TaxID=1432307 RepID=W9CAM8_SCLBF|nr:hypothetical protein SBOR_6710 [Sclerotinia borealis F-4128]